MPNSWTDFCPECGHDFAAHEWRLDYGEEGQEGSGGRMVCPVKGCTLCTMRWRIAEVRREAFGD